MFVYYITCFSITAPKREAYTYVIFIVPKSSECCVILMSSLGLLGKINVSYTQLSYEVIVAAIVDL